MALHSHQDALSEKEFEALLEAADRFDYPYDVETRFVPIATGRLGLRAGELAHMRESWVDWDREKIEIPHYQECTKGCNGGICGYCKKQARQQVPKSDGEIGLQEELDNRYSPTTATSARAVPFGFDDDGRDAVDEFYFKYGKHPKSRVSINRRVDDALLGLLFAAELDNHVQLALIWGGDVCTGTGEMVSTCGVPPVGLSASLLAAVLVVGVILRGLWRLFREDEG